MAGRFSDLASASKSSQEAQLAAEQALAAARAAQAEARADVVAALKGPGKAALVEPDGSISIYSLTAAGDDYTVETVAGDFDVPDAEPATDPEPAEPGDGSSPAGGEALAA